MNTPQGAAGRPNKSPWFPKDGAEAGLVITGFFLCRMPWWGISWLNHPEWPRWIGRVLQNADTFGSLMALGLLWWALHLPEPWSTPGEDGADTEPAAYPTPLQQPLLAKEN